MPRRQSVFVALVLVFLIGVLWTFSGYSDIAHLPASRDAFWPSRQSDTVNVPDEKAALDSPDFEASPPPRLPVPRPPPAPQAPPTVHYETVYLQAPPREPEPIVITFVTIGAGSAREGSVAIKSALMHSSRPLHFHIICSEDARAVHESRFALFSRPSYPVEVFFYTVSGEDVRRRSERAGIGRNYNLLVKTFIHELLVNVEKTLFVDTDMIFVVDPLQLWNNFDKFTPSTLVSFPTLGDKADAARICTCVMLLNLAGMRNAPFMPSTLLPETERTSLASYAFERARVDGIVDLNDHSKTIAWDPYDPLFADQGIYHVIWTYRKEHFQSLSLRWDITQCRAGYGLTLGTFDANDDKGRPDGEDITEDEQASRQYWHEASGERFLSPGILHFNCQPDAGANVWEWKENHNRNTWGPMVTTVVRFKWAWLNRGDGSAHVKVTTVKDVQWEDERRAAMGDSRGAIPGAMDQPLDDDRLDDYRT